MSLRFSPHRIDARHSMADRTAGEDAAEREQGPKLAEWRAVWASRRAELAERMRGIESCLDEICSVESPSTRLTILPAPRESLTK